MLYVHTLKTETVAQLRDTAQKLVALEAAEVAHDLSAKGLLNLIKSEFDAIPEDAKLTGREKGGIVLGALNIELASINLSKTQKARVQRHLDVIAAYYANNLRINAELIPFTLFERVVELLKSDAKPWGIPKAALDAVWKKNLDSKDLQKALQDLCTMADMRALQGTVKAEKLPAPLKAELEKLDPTLLQLVGQYARLLKMQADTAKPEAEAALVASETVVIPEAEAVVTPVIPEEKVA